MKALKNLKGNTPRVTYESGKSCEIDHARTMLRAYLFINKESQHVSKATLKELDAKDVLLVFPEKSKKNKTVRVLKTPKTDSSVTYKLKLNGGDIKAVQGDSGHAQVSMVTDVYSHILDDDRKKNAELFEEAFYEKKDLDPQMHPNTAQNTVAVPEGVDAELLAKVLSNPEMAALLASLAKTMK